MLHVGQVIGGKLRIDRVIGTGGMGTVVAASHLELQHEVAVKVLDDEGAANPVTVERFLREARAVAKLRTEHVCRVLDVGRLDSGVPYIVMELLAGTDLQSAIAREPLPTALACEYIIQACVALAEAHAAGVVHRDLKPANLFVTRGADGGRFVKVLDFGIAKAATAAEARLTHTTAMLGSPGFMSPEQIQSARDVDLRTDIWALGATLHFLLSRELPFEGGNATEMATHVIVSPPRPLAVEPGLQAVVLRCLEKDPDARYQDVATLATALAPFAGPAARRFVDAIAGTRPAPAPQVAPGAPVRDPRKLALIAAAVALAGGGAVAGFLLIHHDAAPKTAAVTADAASAPPAPDATTTLVASRPAAPPDAASPEAASPGAAPHGTTRAVAASSEAAPQGAAQPAAAPQLERPRKPSAVTCTGKSNLSAQERSWLAAPVTALGTTNDPAGKQSILLSLVSLMCECHDRRAQRYFDRLTTNRAAAQSLCAGYGVKLVDR